MARPMAEMLVEDERRKYSRSKDRSLERDKSFDKSVKRRRGRSHEKERSGKEHDVEIIQEREDDGSIQSERDGMRAEASAKSDGERRRDRYKWVRERREAERRKREEEEKMWWKRQFSQCLQYNCKFVKDIRYTMNNEILHSLGKNVLFDSHCHMDFIMFWKSPELELESFDQFVHAYPVLDHPSLEGFITNFCCPKIWLEHLVPPSPLVHSMLSRPSVFYTVGCHPHYATDLLSSRKFAQLELLVQNAGAKCVAIGECGLDTSSKNTVRMSEQVLCFQKQVRLAMKYEKPLVLHIRGAEKEAIEALEAVGLPRDWPIHRYFVIFCFPSPFNQKFL